MSANRNTRWNIIFHKYKHLQGGAVTIQTQFNTFHKRIKLGRKDPDYKKARERDDSITAKVKTEYKNKGYAVIDDFLVGSHGTNTAIRPLSGDMDIDRALVIDDDKAPENPIEPKNTTLSVLEDRGFKNALIKKPCVTADYASDNVHIDYPTYKKSGKDYYLAVGKKNSDENNREWGIADPIGLRDWINNRSSYGDNDKEKQNQYRRLVRYLKRWRDNKFSEPTRSKVYSIGLTVMAKECLSNEIDADGEPNDLKALRMTVDKMLNRNYFCLVDSKEGRYKVRVDLPVKPGRDIFENSGTETGTQFRNKLNKMSEKLKQAEALENVREQCKILERLFGSDFPVPDKDNEKKAGLLKSATAASSISASKVAFSDQQRVPKKPGYFA